VPALTLVALATLVRAPRWHPAAAGAMLACGLQGMAFGLSRPQADGYILDRLDQHGLLIAGYGVLALAGLLACAAPPLAARALVRADGSRPALVPALVTLAGAVLLLAGISAAWTRSDNDGDGLSLYHNESSTGRYGLLAALALVAVVAGLLGRRRVPRPLAVGGAALGLGLQIGLHFGYLAWQIGSLAELHLRAGTVLGLAAGVVTAAGGVLALRGAARQRGIQAA
jgi:hypothetical protein